MRDNIVIQESHTNQTVLNVPAPSCCRPMEVPAPDAVLVDRARERRDLLRIAFRRSRSKVVLFSGVAGIGRRSLVRSWAARFERLFPDGQLYVDFASSRDGGSVPLADLLRSKVRALGESARGDELLPDEVGNAYQTATHGKRLLVVLENVASESEIRPFVPNSDGALVLATGHPFAAGDDSGFSRMLPFPQLIERRVFGLDDWNARKLVARVLWDARQARLAVVALRGGADVDAIVRYCNGIPLVLTHSAQLVARGVCSFGDLKRALVPPPGPRGPGDRFERLWEAVIASIPSDLVKREFALLGLLPLPSASEPLLGYLWDAEDEAALRQTLMDLWPLDSRSACGRHRESDLRLHAPLHDCARKRSRELSHDEAFAARGRLVRFYRQLSQAMDCDAPRLRIYVAQEQDRAVEEYVRRLLPTGAFEAEWDGMLKFLTELGPDSEFADDVWQIGEALWPSIFENCLYQAGFDLYGTCCACAERVGNADALARLLALRSRCASNVGDRERARALIERAAVCAKDTSNVRLLASIHEFKGAVLSKQGDHREATEAYGVARDLFARQGDVRGVVLVDYLMGRELVAEGDSEGALERFGWAMERVDEEKDTVSAVKISQAFAEVEFSLARLPRAAEHARRAYDLSKRKGYRLHRARAAELLASCLLDLGAHREALDVACEELADVPSSSDGNESSALAERIEAYGLSGIVRRRLFLVRTKRLLRGCLARAAALLLRRWR